MIKNEKNEENCNFPFFGKCVHHWKPKWWKTDLKKNWLKKKKKTRRKLQFSIFLEKFLHHWKQKWWNMKKWKNNEKKVKENCNFPCFAEFLHHWKQKWWNMKKKWKIKNMIKTRGKLQFSIFWKFFAPLEAKMMKHDKEWKKKINKWKKRGNCNVPFFGKCLHHWKQKWWKMINKWKKW